VPTESVFGALLSLATAFLWSLAPIFWASAGRRIGAFNVNLLRLLLATPMLVAVVVAAAMLSGRAIAWPEWSQVAWMTLSGVAGIMIGDTCYYAAVMKLGPRRAVHVLTLSPVATVAMAWLWLGEELPLRAIVGIAVVLASVGYLAWAESRAQENATTEPGRVTVVGLALLVAGAVFIGLGAVLGRKAYLAGGPMDPLVATTIRVGTSMALLWLLPLARGTAAKSARHVANAPVLWRLLGGTLVGPFGGMLCYVAALKHVEAGLVMTLTATGPLFILPVVRWRYKVQLSPQVLVATVLAVAGVAVIFWTG